MRVAVNDGDTEYKKPSPDPRTVVAPYVAPYCLNEYASPPRTSSAGSADHTRRRPAPGFNASSPALLMKLPPDASTNDSPLPVAVSTPLTTMSPDSVWARSVAKFAVENASPFESRR